MITSSCIPLCCGVKENGHFPSTYCVLSPISSASRVWEVSKNVPTFRSGNRPHRAGDLCQIPQLEMAPAPEPTCHGPCPEPFPDTQLPPGTHQPWRFNTLRQEFTCVALHTFHEGSSPLQGSLVPTVGWL